MEAGPGTRSFADDLAEVLIRGRLLLSSYAPLCAILAARTSDETRDVFAALAILGVLDAARLTWLSGKLAPSPRRLTEVHDAGSEVAGYLATYLLPFLVAPHPTHGELIGYLLYALVVVAVTIRSNLGIVNPTIYLLGWRIALVTLSDGRERYLICRHIPDSTEPVRVANFFGVLRTED